MILWPQLCPLPNDPLQVVSFQVHTTVAFFVSLYHSIGCLTVSHHFSGKADPLHNWSATHQTPPNFSTLTLCGIFNIFFCCLNLKKAATSRLIIRWAQGWLSEEQNRKPTKPTGRERKKAQTIAGTCQASRQEVCALFLHTKH